MLAETYLDCSDFLSLADTKGKTEEANDRVCQFSRIVIIFFLILVF